MSYVNTKPGFGLCPHCGEGAIILETHPRSQRYEIRPVENDCPVNDPDCLGDDGDCHDACERGPEVEWVRVDVDDEPTERLYCNHCDALAHDAELCGRIMDALPAPPWEAPR